MMSLSFFEQPLTPTRCSLVLPPCQTRLERAWTRTNVDAPAKEHATAKPFCLFHCTAGKPHQSPLTPFRSLLVRDGLLVDSCWQIFSTHTKVAEIVWLSRRRWRSSEEVRCARAEWPRRKRNALHAEESADDPDQLCSVCV